MPYSFTFWTIKWIQIINYEIPLHDKASSLKAFLIHIQYESFLFTFSLAFGFLKFICHCGVFQMIPSS